MKQMRYYSLARNELQVQLTCVAINARRALVLRREKTCLSIAGN